MRHKSGQTATWVVDYSEARAHAIRWLGDRYLLARPINGSRFWARPVTPGISSPLAVKPQDLVPAADAPGGAVP
jgi:hypothetical protein